MHVYAVIFQGINQERVGLHINESLCCVLVFSPLNPWVLEFFKPTKLNSNLLKRMKQKSLFFLFCGVGDGAFWGECGYLVCCQHVSLVIDNECTSLVPPRTHWRFNHSDHDCRSGLHVTKVFCVLGYTEGPATQLTHPGNQKTDKKPHHQARRRTTFLFYI